MFVILVATLLSMNGTWVLTTQSAPTNLSIFQQGKSVIGVLQIDSGTQKKQKGCLAWQNF